MRIQTYSSLTGEDRITDGVNHAFNRLLQIFGGSTKNEQALAGQPVQPYTLDRALCDVA